MIAGTRRCLMFLNRKDAGSRLAPRLERYKHRSDVLVLALPRGGVVTGFELARIIGAPLDVLIVRKIGVPYQPELAAGAVAETGAVVLNKDIMDLAGLSEESLRTEIERQKEEIERRIALYRGGRGLPELEGRTIVLVDDGVATGATMKAAIAALKREKIAALVLALPV